MEEKIKKIIKEDITPILEADGGYAEFVGFKDGIVTVRLSGACAGCQFSKMTLINIVEKALKSKLPNVQKVETAV